LLHDLENEGHKDKPVYKHIDTTRNVRPTALYGTSGAGKTRSVFEYLSHNHGLFFVASDHEKNAGSEDLTTLLAMFGECCNIIGVGDIQGSETNLVTMKRWVSVVVYVRYAVLNWINEMLNNGNRPGLTPFQWLLLQLYPKKYLGGDVFTEVTRRCINRADLSSNKLLNFEDFKELKGVKSLGVPFIDEAQMLLTQLLYRFLSGDDGRTRSAFTALLNCFSSMYKTCGTGYPVFSGTGLSIDA